MAAVRGEVLILLLAVALQVTYQWAYSALVQPEASQPEASASPPRGASPGPQAAASEPAQQRPEAMREAVQVNEYLSADCEGPVARQWHIRPASRGECLALRPRMSTPSGAGRGAHSVANEVLFGRVSCADLVLYIYIYI